MGTPRPLAGQALAPSSAQADHGGDRNNPYEDPISNLHRLMHEMSSACTQAIGNLLNDAQNKHMDAGLPKLLAHQVLQKHEDIDKLANRFKSEVKTQQEQLEEISRLIRMNDEASAKLRSRVDEVRETRAQVRHQLEQYDVWLHTLEGV